jgi:hypothetical protein
MAAAKLGNLLAQQVERSKAQESVTVQFIANLPGDGSMVNMDWWQREINRQLSPIGISLEFADLDLPGQVSPLQVVQMKRKIAELQSLVADYEENMREKAMELAGQMVAAGDGLQVNALSKKEQARRAVEQDGVFVDEHGARWVSLETEAARINRPYIALWRACKSIGCNRAESWVVGKVQSGGDRLLIKEGSFNPGKRKKKTRK